ncbi:MAG: hypothetical protein ACRC8S_12170 [Fimbriiglobus sp.]
MATHYNPRGVLRCGKLELWRQVFEKFGMAGDVDWKRMKVKNLYPLWEGWPAEVRARAEVLWQQLHQLRFTAATQVMIEEARLAGLQVPNVELGYGPIDLAIWLYLNSPTTFERACRFQHVDSSSNRYWHFLPGSGPCEPRTDPAALNAIGDAMSRYLQDKQGRGHRCSVEHYLRQGSEHYYFIYPDDYTRVEAGHSKDGELERLPVRRALEIIIVLEALTGDLYLHADPTLPNRKDLTKLFTDSLCLKEPGTSDLRKPPYELDVLMDPEFELAVPRESIIEKISITRLRASIERAHQRVIVEETPVKSGSDLRQLLNTVLPEASFPRETLHLTEATFAVTYRPSDAKRDKTFRFRVAYPDACNLKTLPDQERLLGEACLRQWGIARG